MDVDVDTAPIFPGRPDLGLTDRTLNVKRSKTAVVKCAWPPSAKKTREKDMYDAAAGDFGTPELLA